MDPLTFFIRMFGLVIWVLVLVQAILIRHEPLRGNRPRRLMLVTVIAAYAIALGIGSLSQGNGGPIPGDIVSQFYTIVSAISGVAGIIVLASPVAKEPPVPLAPIPDDEIDRRTAPPVR